MSLEDEFATLSLHIDTHSTEPLYQQLANQIKRFIDDKRLTPGQRLPSSRKLAELLGVSRTSTINACEQLIAQGYLVTRPSSGVYVSSLSTAHNKQAVTHNSEAAERNLEKAPKQTDKMDRLIAFDSGADLSLFPFNEWARCSARVWRKKDAHALRSFSAGGYEPLKEAVVNYLKMLRNIDCSAQQVIITAGSRDALTLIAKVVIDDDQQANQSTVNMSQVALENPSYPPLNHGFKAQNCHLNYCEVDDHGAIIPNTETDLAWLATTAQYPLGVTMSMQRRLDWLSYSQVNHCWIIEDDYDSEFQYHKSPLASLFSLSKSLYLEEQQRVIFTGSFSKVLFRTLRMGFMVVPQSLVNKFHLAQQELGSVASLPTQIVLSDFLKSRRFFSHLRKMKKQYQQRRDYLYQLLQSEVSIYFNVELASCGTHLIITPTAKNYMLDTQLVAQLASFGFNAAALSTHYSASKSAKQGLILGFSGTDECQTQLAVVQMKKILLAFHLHSNQTQTR